MKGKINKPEDKYIIRCIRCGETNKLSMIPHRLEGLIGGIIFSCENCMESLFDQDIEVKYKDITGTYEP